MKKLLIIFVFLILIFSQGCAKDDKIHVSFSTWGSQSEIATIKSLINDFERSNPEIKVDLIHIPDNYFQKLHLLIASNLSPDIIFVNNLNAKIYINSKKFEPLNFYIDNSKVLNKNEFMEKSFLPVTQNGEIFVMPRDISNLVVYYNKTLFDEYKIPYPESGWTMDDFLNTALKFKGKSNVFGFGFEKKSLFWLPFLLSNGGGILSDAGNIILDSQKSINAIQFYSDLRNKYKVTPSDAEQASLTTSQMFMQNKVAMHLCGRWCSLTYRKNKDLKWDIIEFPKGEKGSIVGLDVSGWAISSSSKHKNEAWKFIEFMTSDKSMVELTKDGLIVPSKKKIAFSNVFLDGYPTNAKAFLTTVDTSVPTSTCEKYAQIDDIIYEAFESLFQGKVHAKDIMTTKLSNKLRALVDKY